jgi:hypothetical protein
MRHIPHVHFSSCHKVAKWQETTEKAKKNGVEKGLARIWSLPSNLEALAGCCQRRTAVCSPDGRSRRVLPNEHFRPRGLGQPYERMAVGFVS